MSSYNCPEVMGYDFFEIPDSVKGTQVDFLFNKIHGTLPEVVSFNDPHNSTCLEAVAQYFDRLTGISSVHSDKTFEQTFWIGKFETAFEGVVLRTMHKVKGETAQHYSDIVGDSEIFSRHTEVKDNDKISVHVIAACNDKQQINKLIELFKNYRIPKESSMYILSNQYGDLVFSPLTMPGAKTDLELNYGPEFIETHKAVVDNLNSKNSGLYLFYGPPGTGKSSYIKHLLTGEVKRKIAYIPVSLINQLVSPDLVPLLMDNKDIVLVMEDAEQALLSRDIAGDNAAIVSSILNLTDGFIGQALNISIIATFNTEKDKIDEALLRKGRLRMSHEFTNLSEDLARNLAEKLGHDPDRVKGSMSLADVYNLTTDTGFKPKEERRVGFN